jgi:hypothetical protein
MRLYSKPCALHLGRSSESSTLFFITQQKEARKQAMCVDTKAGRSKQHEGCIKVHEEHTARPEHTAAVKY